mmetsp:Transcript_29883/g.54218  ORF Transcript_29883/g.54218 Transcript_29883/m.54218 type:complete len:313 (-) Transcript_29883:242-1180(-)|eukprot:CAMPEP_0201891506 /NCGR_PEP_ID=MMETSP0902-20130614/34580_1 /ASSEMBLY_ACC=CAM_ASM_000551 /TAXON_ID=420261 /ORGANISM="Thalassiosira antarctica, Strain CCMP982" /LENGTH=312 /DNA_ID=CAMNT_0048422729 /DNA_START=300 /DNA_END=1238 /DNA_ORIENTATION=-
MASLLHLVLSAIFLLQWHVKLTAAFQAPIPTSLVQRQLSRSAVVLGATSEDDGNAALAEAEQLLAQAKAIRDSLPESSSKSDSSTTISGQEGKIVSQFSLPTPESSENGYRLYVDIGREPGTWMDARWGGSGQRIECTIDVSFPRPMEGEDTNELLASVEITSGLLKTITKGKSSSQIYKLQSAPCARLRGGFGKMYIDEGGYCIESNSSSKSLSSSSTLRFCLSVDGAADKDVTIPEGNLYFALPYFGLRTDRGGGDDDSTTTQTMALSTKEGTITVKQMGWNTGWWREESRILGVFRAVELEKARKRDKF